MPELTIVTSSHETRLSTPIEPTLFENASVIQVEARARVAGDFLMALGRQRIAGAVATLASAAATARQRLVCAR